MLAHLPRKHDRVVLEATTHGLLLQAIRLLRATQSATEEIGWPLGAPSSFPMASGLRLDPLAKQAVE